MSKANKSEIEILTRHLMSTAKSKEDSWFDSHASTIQVDKIENGDVFITWRERDNDYRRQYVIKLISVESEKTSDE